VEVAEVSDRLVNRLREERSRLGITQAELAQMVGVSRKTINTVENGVFVPSTLLALKLAQAIGKRVEELFFIPSDDA
jgi:putative transcriptional regulator